MKERYVVTKRSAGLGDLLISLWSAWWYAKHTNRTLVVDWRNATYSKDNQQNLFFEILEAPQEIDGVQLRGGIPNFNLLRSPDFYPSVWDPENIHMGIRETAEQRQLQQDLIKNCEDKRESVVIFSECLANLIPDPHQEKQFFKQLRFNLTWVQMADTFAKKKFGDKRIIGLHMRHGNGGDIMGHTPYWKNVEHSLSTCCELLEKCTSLFPENSYAIYLATDSIVVEEKILSLFPQAITYPKKHRITDAGELHRWNNDASALQDSVIEMLLLAKSEILLRFPPGSFFSHYASMMKPSSELNPEALKQFCEMDYGPKVVI